MYDKYSECGCVCEREREEGGIEMGKKERTRASNLCEMIYLEMGLLWVLIIDCVSWISY